MSGHQQSDSDQTKLSQQSAADTRSDVPTSVELRCSKIRRFWRRAFAGTTSLAFLISIARSRKFVLQSQHLLMIHFYERSNLDRKSTRLTSRHYCATRMPSSA